ncbi:MAG TPA: AsmA family protein [Chitinivibrionales bacterium]|nr:AsmA family protein [Chitinivibrionales bacterium]
MKKSPFTIVIVILIVIAVLIGGGIAAMYILFPPDRIAAIIVPPVEKALGRKVTLQKAGITLFPRLGVSLSGLEVANTGREGFSGEPFVSVEKFTAAIGLMSIFKGYPEITSILIRKPQVRVETDAKGAFNFNDLAVLAKDTTQKPEATTQGPPQLPVPVTLKKLSIENGEIVYNDRKSGSQVIIGNMNETVAVSMDKELKNITTSGDLVLTDVSVKTKEIKKPLSNLKITLSHDVAANLVDAGGTVTVNKVRLSLQKIFLEVKGTVSKAMTPAPEFDLAVASDPISVADALKEVPVELVPLVTKVSATGAIVLGLAVKGVLAAKGPLPLQGRLELKDITMKYAGMPQAISGLNADIAFTDNSLAIKTMKMQFGTNPIDIHATVNNFKKPYVDAAVLADIKLGEVKDIVALPKDAMLDGRVTADIKARGEADPADPTKLDLKGNVDLQNVRMVWSPLIKPAEISGGLTISTVAVGQNMAVRIGSSSFTMNTTIKNFLSLLLPDKTKKFPRTTVDFKMNSPYLNADDILAPPKPEPKTEPPETGGGSSELPIVPIPADINGLVTAGKIIYHGITMDRLVAKVKVINDVALVDFTTGFAGGTIGTVLNADMRNPKNVVVKNTLTVKSVEVNDLMQQFGGYLKPVTPLNKELSGINKCLFGRINLQSSITGSGGTTDALMKSLAGNIGTQMANGKIQGAPVQKVIGSSFSSFTKTNKLGNFDAINIQNLSAAVRLAGGAAQFDNLKIMSDVADWNAHGKVGFDALMDMAVSSRLNKNLSAVILGAEGAVKSGLKGVLSRTSLAGASGLLDQTSIIPRDKDGRVTLNFGLGGPVGSPKITGLSFGAGSPGGTQRVATPQQQVQQRAQQVIQQKKQEVQQAVEQKKQETVKKVEDQIGNAAKGKLKGIFGK